MARWQAQLQDSPGCGEDHAIGYVPYALERNQAIKTTKSDIWYKWLAHALTSTQLASILWRYVSDKSSANSLNAST